MFLSGRLGEANQLPENVVKFIGGGPRKTRLIKELKEGSYKNFHFALGLVLCPKELVEPYWREPKTLDEFWGYKKLQEKRRIPKESECGRVIRDKILAYYGEAPVSFLPSPVEAPVAIEEVTGEILPPEEPGVLGISWKWIAIGVGGLIAVKVLMKKRGRK